MIEELDSSGRTVVGEAGGAPIAAAEPEEYSLDAPLPAVGRPVAPLRWWRWLRSGQVPAAALLAVAVLAGAAVAVAMHLWDGYAQLRAERATVSVVAGVASNLSGTGNDDGLSLDGSVMMINAGPAPVRIEDLHASQPGVTVVLLPGAVDVLPARSAGLSVHLTLKCYPSIFRDPLPLTMSVRAADGHLHTVATSFDARPWSDACFPPSAG